MLTYLQALEAVESLAQLQPHVELPLSRCLGYVLAEPVYADRDYPPFNRAAMDGYAIKFKDAASKTPLYVEATIFAGSDLQIEILSGNCAKIMTGAPVPPGADTVVKKEDVVCSDNKITFLSYTGLIKGMNIASQGQDFLQGTCVYAPGTLISTGVWSTLASLGRQVVKVYQPPSAAVLSTGDEIQPVSDVINKYQIRDSNRYSITGVLSNYKITVSRQRIVADEKVFLEKAVGELLTADLLFITGGVSAGDADFVPEVLKEAAVKQVFYKVAIKPGKPIWVGKTHSGGIVFALPGNPFSVQVALKIFVEPFLRKLFNMSPTQVWRLPLAAPRIKKTKIDEFFPCTLNRDGMVLNQVTTQGSGDISTMARSDGVAWHPHHLGNIEIDYKVNFFPWTGMWR